MSSMLLMDDLRFTLAVQIRTDPKAKLALDRVVAEARATDRLKWKGKRPTQEAIFAAVWLWLEELPPEEFADAMARYLPRLEALMRGEPKEASSLDVTAEVDAASEPRPRRRRGHA